MPAHEHLSPDEFENYLGNGNGNGKSHSMKFGDSSNLLRDELRTDAGRVLGDRSGRAPAGLVEYSPRTQMLAALATHDSYAADDEAVFYTQEVTETRVN